jgi:signal transduction histidine kinase
VIRLRDRLPGPMRALISMLGSASIKVRLGVAIVSGVGASIATVLVALFFNVPWPLATAVAALASLAIIQFLARGTTAPLRTMATAAEAMASGDYTIRIPTDVGASEVRKLARTFDQMAMQLAEVDRFRRDLVANAAHELRTPITVIRAVAENLVDGVSEPGPEQLAMMLNQAERLGRLVEQLLDLSRLESGVVPLRPTPVAVHELLEEVAATIRLRSDDVTVVVSGNDELRVLADEERLRQVVTNLGDNALRHAPHDSKIRLSAEALGDGIRLVVEDEGPGIADEDAARVFERFSRLDSARRAQDGGAGLGLSIVRWIVELHGGTIVPEQVEPSGCRMVVTLPTRAG